jgi:hypothetical protein
MNWQPPLSDYADDTGTAWHVHRAWHDKKPGDYVLEVVTPGRPGVRAAHLESGHFELLPLDDPELPALRAEAHRGEIVSHRPHARAVIRTAGCYIKIFRPGEAIVPTQRCAQTAILLDAGAFTAPRVVRSSADVIVFSTIPGRTLGELGHDHVTVSDESLARVWRKWSHAWTAQVGASYDVARRSALATLPLHSPEVEVADLLRWMNRWLRHYGTVPEASSHREALCARAEDVTQNLLRTAADPLVWAHGDLHDKQIIAVDETSPLGLLDFDDTAQAEAALDLANLDVHLELHMRQHRLTPERYLAAHTQVLAAGDELQVSPGRLQAYSDAAWLRLACSPIPARASLALAVLNGRPTPPPIRRAQELVT